MPAKTKLYRDIRGFTHKECIGLYSRHLQRDAVKNNREVESNGGVIVVGTVSEVYEFFTSEGSVSWTRIAAMAGVRLTVSAECGAHPFAVPTLASNFRKQPIPTDRETRREMYSIARTRLLVVHVGSENNLLRRQHRTHETTLSYNRIRPMIGNLLRGIDVFAWSKASRRLPSPPVW